MFFFLISCFSFILVSKSFCLWKHPRMAKRQWRLVSPWLWEALSSFTVSWLQKGRVGIGLLNQIPKMKMMVLGWVWHHHHGSKEEKDRMISLLDLPELTLECILERLPPSGLCSVAGVCSSFRERCTSDHLWEKHMKQKWSKVIGEAAYREWQGYVHLASASYARKRPSQSASLSGPRKQNQNWFLGFLTNKINYKWSFSWFRPNIENSSFSLRTDLPVDSIMSCYLSLETGKFWFPAQVYNRENGHAGFMLSCYDAKLSYDSKTDTFQARYGRRTSEDNISWDRIRVPPIDTSSDVLHISDCLHDLKPGDHIEIQWRRNEEFPYGWWYGVVGHLESCDPNQTHCQCQHSESVMLEFKQYGDNSRWRRTMINRKEHREIGNEADGFYGGIRKLYKEEEISMWKRVWPNQILQ